jgi:hypothetical protein
MDARVGPACFPMVQIGLGCLQAFKTQPFQRRVLRVADAPFHLPFAIRIGHPAGQRDGLVVPQYVAVQRVDGGIVDVGDEYAFA